MYLDSQFGQQHIHSLRQPPVRAALQLVGLSPSKKSVNCDRFFRWYREPDLNRHELMLTRF